MTAQKYQDLHYPHPDEILRTEFMEELGITQYRLAVDTKIIKWTYFTRKISSTTANTGMCE